MRAALATVALALAACDSAVDEDAAPAEPFERRYPEDITPPPGTEYPCAVTALPADLEGIPPSHRRFIDHAYALILSAVHERLKVHAGRSAFDAYEGATRELVAKLRALPAPKSLEAFREDVVAGLELEVEFYRKSAAGEKSPPEGRRASARLQAAWAKMQARYPKWSKPVRDAVFHHLCALDIY